MKIYLAGPMRGYDQFNFPAFAAAAKVLRADGHVVFSPAEHDIEGGFDPSLNTLDGFDLQAAMRWDIETVIHSDRVVVLPGWHASHGCQVEVMVADSIGIPVLSYPNLTPAEPESVCAEADRIVGGARRSTYGHPWENFLSTGLMWEGITGHSFTPEQVALMLIALKMSRLVTSPDHRDSVVDIAGYAKTLSLVQQRRAQTKGNT
jgi:nucleoside 2-deoxyribosyltransferase